MSPPTETLQRIARLAPLAELLARLDAVVIPVAPRNAELAAAVGATLAADILASSDLPAAPTAIRDGWAVASEMVLDASSFAPVPLIPPPAWVETGGAMPAGTDAILPVDAVNISNAGAEALASVAPGEGVMLAGADAARGAVLRRAGERLRPSDAAVLRAAGIASVSVRAPRVKIFCASVPTRSQADTISPMIARAVEAEGGIAQVAQAASLDSALLDRGSDAIIAIGGTGTGMRDASVKTLARIGQVEIHGFGVSPGETAAFGVANSHPVLLLPGRIDAALAAFLVVGCAMLRRLAGCSGADPAIPVKLAKKVASTVGLAEVVLVRLGENGAEPLGTGVFSLQALARADGWILVAPESEGLPAGAIAEMRLLP